jgi:hypothetical protein
MNLILLLALLQTSDESYVHQHFTQATLYQQCRDGAAYCVTLENLGPRCKSGNCKIDNCSDPQGWGGSRIGEGRTEQEAWHNAALHIRSWDRQG